MFLTRDWHPANHCSFQANNPGTKLYESVKLPDMGVAQMMWPVHCVQHSKGAEFSKDLERLENDVIISKG